MLRLEHTREPTFATLLPEFVPEMGTTLVAMLLKGVEYNEVDEPIADVIFDVTACATGLQEN